ncbi:toprim domain-containing protein [Niabella insulamsoli]|uniref:toprim domain-containing protein n=1 Tax=Niabella insulamsoli TaxID=3144874 RepID=UPI0031FBD122
MTPQKWNCEQVKKMDLVSYLETLNIRPAKVRGNDYWYYSPFHQEKTPSFKINRKLNVWYDHSLGKGGNLIDFGITYFNCDVSSFLEKINSQSLDFSFQQQHFLEAGLAKNLKEKEASKIQILGIKNIEDNQLKNYFESRGISLAIARKYCSEITLASGQKKFPVIGFKNQSGGYELRSAGSFKSTIKPKDFSFFQQERKSLAVVEGFFDFLSLLEKQHAILPELTNFLVLNSLSFFDKAMPLMQQYDRVYLLLDNDSAGKHATSLALKRSQNFIDLSHKYGLHKDLNEWLVKEKALAQQRLYSRGLGLNR